MPALRPPLLLGLLLLLLSPVAAQESAQLASVDRQTQVSVLCYHDFTSTGSPTPMRMKTEDFRAQMQALRDGGVEVVSMEDFLAWRRGERNLPDPSVVLTFDDGWRSVYEEAFPILQEFGAPFTIYLYTNFLDIGGQSLTKGEILEMQANGATIGCHSTSHPYPQAVLAVINRNDTEGLAEFLAKEMQDSREFLREQFDTEASTYAYPGGFYNNAIRDYGLAEAGYEELFTVNPARARWDTPRGEVNRFVIHGDDLATFVAATTFRGIPLGGAVEHEGIRLRPEADATTSERLPLIEANLSSIGPIDPDSLILRISGLGEVPAIYDAASGVVRYAVRAPLRSHEIEVFLSWQRAGAAERDAPLIWSFNINREARYEPFHLPELPALEAEDELRPASDTATVEPVEAAEPVDASAG